MTSELEGPRCMVCTGRLRLLPMGDVNSVRLKCYDCVSVYWYKLDDVIVNYSNARVQLWQRDNLMSG